MNTRLVARSPQMIILAALLILMISGLLVFLLLIHELSAPMWSRPAIFLQLVALGVALVATPLLPTKRLVLHPLLGAGTIYLWDVTLPPPTLSHELARAYLPLLIIALIVADGLLVLWHTARQQPGKARTGSMHGVGARPLPGYRHHAPIAGKRHSNGHHVPSRRPLDQPQPVAQLEQHGPQHVDELLPHITRSAFLNTLIAACLASLALAVPALFLLILAALFL